jgi:hypothetical protein
MHDSCGCMSSFIAGVTHLSPCGFRWFLYVHNLYMNLVVK